MNKAHFPFAIILAMTLFEGCAHANTTGEVAPRRAPARLQTTGPIADGPLQVVTTNPFQTQTPRWLFPMYRFKWKPMQQRGKTVEDFARLYVAEFRRRNDPTQPVWIELWTWTGQYKGGWDRDHLLAHHRDVTPRGTPGIWPNKGIQFWRIQTQRFINVLQANGVRVDGLFDDNETNITRFNSNFAHPNCFRNMVLDPRWKSEPILGLGVTGAQLLDPAGLAKDPPAQPRRRGVEDSIVAVNHVEVLGRFVNAVARQKAFYDPFLNAYPDLLINKYGGTYGLPLDWSQDTPFPLRREYEKRSHPPVWKKLGRLVSRNVTSMPDFGNTCGPVFYGVKNRRTAKMVGDDQVQYYLDVVDDLVGRGIPPQRIMPWLSMPNNPRKDDPQAMRMSPQEWERLAVGLAGRGVRQFFLFNPLKRESRESEEQAIACLRRAYDAAARRGP